MKLKERKENLYRYLNLKESVVDEKKTIRGSYNRIASGRITKSLTNERDNRTTNKIVVAP